MVRSLDEMISAHTGFRDHVADRVHGVRESNLDVPYALVLTKSFTFCFNTFKAIGLLLPDQHHEAGCALLRIMWEASLNLAWVSLNSNERARAFLQFTAVETHKTFKNRILEQEMRGELEAAAVMRTELKRFQDRFAVVLDEYRDRSKKGAGPLAQRFSLGNLEKVANELGHSWALEYRGIYPLLCSYAHGSPGVVIFPTPFVEDFAEIEPEVALQRDEPRTVMLGLWSMEVFERTDSLLLRVHGEDDDEYLNDLHRKVGFRGSLRRDAG
jgi:hypothetical protein